MSKKVKICLLYPTDPVGEIIGGIESFIRGLISAAPSDIEYNVVGATTDPVQRPVGVWTKCRIKNKEFNYYPLYVIKNSQKRKLIPDTIKHLLYAEIRGPDLSVFNIIESHRVEHFFTVRNTNIPRSLFLHNTMDIVKNKSSDIRWKLLPWLYFWIESRVVKTLDNIMIVREEGVELYESKYPEKKGKIRFTPTVVDVDKFYALDRSDKEEKCLKFKSLHEIDNNKFLISFVGRLDSSKDPELLIDVLEKLILLRTDFVLLLIGDGVLREKLEKRVQLNNISQHIKFLGYKNSDEVADILKISDAFVMTSAYEGMPIALIEAMSCGLPAVSTDVGEVRRLIRPGVNGEIEDKRSADKLSHYLNKVLSNIEAYSGKVCVDAAAPYSPENVFSAVYEIYKRLSDANRC